MDYYINYIDYGAEIWGLKIRKNIDYIQNKALRFFMGVHRYAPILAINGDMGWMTTYERRALCTLRFWNKLVNMDEDRIAKKAF